MQIKWIIFPLVFLAGFVDSIAGGGGLISLTSYLAIGLPAHLALGTNKFSAMPGTGITAFRFAKKGYVNWKSAVTAFLGALAGSGLGSWLIQFIDERIARYILVALVPAVAVFLFLKKDLGTQGRGMPESGIIPYSLLAGLGIGAYDGFFGPGTGTFLIIIFTALLGFDMMTACGNTKIVNFGSNLAAAVMFIINGNVDYSLGVPCVLCGILGNYIGSGLALKKGARLVRPMMLFVISILFAKVVFDIISSR